MGKKTCLTYVELPKKYLAACLKVLVNTFCVCYMDFMLKRFPFIKWMQTKRDQQNGTVYVGNMKTTFLSPKDIFSRL